MRRELEKDGQLVSFEALSPPLKRWPSPLSHSLYASCSKIIGWGRAMQLADVQRTRRLYSYYVFACTSAWRDENLSPARRRKIDFINDSSISYVSRVPRRWPTGNCTHTLLRIIREKESCWLKLIVYGEFTHRWGKYLFLQSLLGSHLVCDSITMSTSLEKNLWKYPNPIDKAILLSSILFHISSEKSKAWLRFLSKVHSLSREPTSIQVCRC